MSTVHPRHRCFMCVSSAAMKSTMPPIPQVHLTPQRAATATKQQKNMRMRVPPLYHPTAVPVRRCRSASQADGQLVPNASTRVPPRVTSWLPRCSPASNTPTPPPRGRRHAGWASRRAASWCSKMRRKARQWQSGTSTNVAHGDTPGAAPSPPRGWTHRRAWLTWRRPLRPLDRWISASSPLPKTPQPAAAAARRRSAPRHCA